jgi:hypothetical protein
VYRLPVRFGLNCVSAGANGVFANLADLDSISFAVDASAEAVGVAE